MYRGFITEVGEVAEATSDGLWVVAPDAAESVLPGGSVALAGVCLSAEARDDDRIRVRLSQETRKRTKLEHVGAGDKLNVEVPMRGGERIEGHLVQGHVDAIGKVVRVVDEPPGRRVWIRPPARFLDALEPKGSIAVDGVSLTVAEVVRDRFSVALVPATLEATTLANLEAGDRVNLEGDLVGKLVRRHREDAPRALARAVAELPWSGVVEGQLGVEKAVRQIGAGGVVIVWDPDREGEGDVIVAGHEIRPETIAFVLTQACGHPCVPCDAARLERLEIPRMSGDGDHQGTAMHVAIDLASARGTGVSAAERAATIRRLAAEDARADDFVRPGHVFPLSARPGLLGERAGHTEATVALLAAGGVPTVGVCCEIMNPDGTMAGLGELERFALHWSVPLVSIEDLVRWL